MICLELSAAALSHPSEAVEFALNLKIVLVKELEEARNDRHKSTTQENESLLWRYRLAEQSQVEVGMVVKRGLQHPDYRMSCQSIDCPEGFAEKRRLETQLIRAIRGVVNSTHLHCPNIVRYALHPRVFHCRFYLLENPSLIGHRVDQYPTEEAEVRPTHGLRAEAYSLR